MKETIYRLLRILLGLFLLALGLTHFYYTIEMAIFVPLPTGAVPFVYIVGAITALCGVLIIINKFVRYALFTVAALLFLTGGMVQLAVETKNPDVILKQVGMANVIKLLLACIILFGLALRKQTISNKHE